MPKQETKTKHSITGEDALDRLATFLRWSVDHIRNGGKGFMVRALDGEEGSIATGFEPTLPQFLAWVAYLDEPRVPHTNLDRHGHGMMPAEWPWFFDVAERDQTAYFEGLAARVMAQHLASRKHGLPPLAMRSMQAAKARAACPREGCEVDAPKEPPNYSSTPPEIGEGLRKVFTNTKKIGEGRL